MSPLDNRECCELGILMKLISKNFNVQEKMVLEWREREHEDMDRLEMSDSMTLNALQRCALLKFYRTSNMRSQVRLLEMLVWLWDPELGMFEL